MWKCLESSPLPLHHIPPPSSSHDLYSQRFESIDKSANLPVEAKIPAQMPTPPLQEPLQTCYISNRV